jgi:uncharacterized coiled-coil protein SlyX
VADELTPEERIRNLEATVTLYEAHTENLIERVYELEELVTRLLARVGAIERAVPWKRPKR